MSTYDEMLTLMGQDPYQRKGREQFNNQTYRGQYNQPTRGGDGYSMSPLRNFKGERDQEAMFIARYGMSPADIMSSYRMSKEKEGEVTPGGPATTRTGAATSRSVTGPLSDVGAFDKEVEGMGVGQRFDSRGQLITKTAAETTEFSPKAKRLQGMYKDMRERISGPSKESQAKIGYYNARSAAAARGTGKDTTFKDLVDYRNSLVAQQGKGHDVTEKLAQVDAKLKEIKGLPATPEAAPKRPGWEWQDYIPGGPKTPRQKYDKLMKQKEEQKIKEFFYGPGASGKSLPGMSNE